MVSENFYRHIPNYNKSVFSLFEAAENMSLAHCWYSLLTAVLLRRRCCWTTGACCSLPA